MPQAHLNPYNAPPTLEGKSRDTEVWKEVDYRRNLIKKIKDFFVKSGTPVRAEMNQESTPKVIPATDTFVDITFPSAERVLENGKKW